MLKTKIKDTTKAAITARSAGAGKASCNGELCYLESKHSIKEYVDEIFAGLIWLG